MTVLQRKSIFKHTYNLTVRLDWNDEAVYSVKDLHDVVIASASTPKAAWRAARTELKKKQVVVAVPFLTNDFRPAIAKGRHRIHRQQILVWIDDGTPKGRTDTVYSYGYRDTIVLRPDVTDEDKAEFQKLIETKARAQTIVQRVTEKQKQWIENHSFNLAKAVDAALKEAQEDPNAPKS